MSAPFAKEERVKLARAEAESPPDPKAAVRRAFPHASEQAPALSELLEAAFAFAAVDLSARVIVVDAAALITAALVTGRRTRRKLSSSRWLLAAVEPAKQSMADSLGSFKMAYEDRLGRLLQGNEVIASRTVLGQVIPRALALAAATMNGQKSFDQRHLLFALCELPPRKWPSIGKPVQADMLAAARRHLVEMIGKSPDKGENMEAWREALDHLPDKENRVGALRDEPAAKDQLGRAAFATVLANRLVEVRTGQDAAMRDDDRAFLVHLDGPWGSGKSSILNFLEADLVKREPSWLIVKFDAWREQKNEPPWWTLITQIALKVRVKLRGWRKLRFALIWAEWNFRTKWGPLVLVLGLAAATIWLWPKDKEGGWQAKDFLALATGFGALAALARAVIFGSGTTAKALEELRSDPYTPVVGLFKRLVSCADRPILVIIDNIDRCDRNYVVGLLENIQTMLRAEPITYLVAGDRKWIVASFENRYAEFSEMMGAPGRPLGHLFLDKLFQLSVSVPRISPSRLSGYWKGLLIPLEAKEAIAEENRSRAQEIVGNEVRPEKLQAVVDRHAANPQLQEALRAEAAIRLASPAASEELEHRYASYGPLLDPNPRAMKRLINAIGLAYSVCLIEGRKVDPDALARWTILELRWPLLAEVLAANRDWLDDPIAVDPAWEPLFNSPEVAGVLARGEDWALTGRIVGQLFGDSA